MPAKPAIAVAILVALSVAPAIAQTQKSWIALTTQPPRNMLFQQYAARRAKESGHLPYALPNTFRFKEDADAQRNGTPRTSALFGIDVSHWDTNVPIEDLRQKYHVRYIYLKATQGTEFADPAFQGYWKRLTALSSADQIPRGAYHFLASDPAQSGTAQADRYLAYVALSGGLSPNDLPPALDLEWDEACSNCADGWQANHRAPNDIIQTAVDFLARVESKTHRVPMVYTNSSFLTDEGITSADQIARLTAHYKIWIFDLSPADARRELANPQTNLAYVLWQFTWAGTLEGQGAYDVDFFSGSDTAFAATFTSGN